METIRKCFDEAKVETKVIDIQISNSHERIFELERVLTEARQSQIRNLKRRILAYETCIMFGKILGENGVAEHYSYERRIEDDTARINKLRGKLSD